MRVRTAAALSLVAAVVPAAGFAAGRTDLIIVADRSVAGVAMGANLDDAAARLGDPDTTRRLSRNECRVIWKGIGLTVSLLDLSTGHPCTNGGIVIATATSSRWRTLKGLRVRDTVQRLRALYPLAIQKRGYGPPLSGWWLVTRHSCPATGSQPYPGLLARTSNGYVSAFVVSLAACE